MWRRLVLALFFAVIACGQPKRIISTSPSITETLFALDLGKYVVGVTVYCRYPSAVLSLPKIGTYSKPDLEKIALLQPDLVIVHKSATNLVERLSALKIPTATTSVGSLAQVYSMIGDIGVATGVPDRAAKLNEQIRSQLAAANNGDLGIQRPSVLMVVGRTPGLLTNLIAAGPTTYLGELLNVAGGRNVLTETTIPYPHISVETAMQSNPDVILDMSTMATATEPRSQEAKLLEPWLTRRDLAAVQNARVFVLSSEALITPGPRVVEAMRLLQENIRVATSKKVKP